MSHRAVAIHMKRWWPWVPLPLVPLIFSPSVWTSPRADKYPISSRLPLFTRVRGMEILGSWTSALRLSNKFALRVSKRLVQERN